MRQLSEFLTYSSYFNQIPSFLGRVFTVFGAMWQNAKDFEPELGLDFSFSPIYFEKEKQDNKNKK